MTLAEELDLVNALLLQAASGGGVAEWQEGAHKVKHYSLKDLLDWRDRVDNALFQSQGGMTMPVVDVRNPLL